MTFPHIYECKRKKKTNFSILLVSILCVIIVYGNEMWGFPAEFYHPLCMSLKLGFEKHPNYKVALLCTEATEYSHAEWR